MLPNVYLLADQVRKQAETTFLVVKAEFIFKNVEIERLYCTISHNHEDSLPLQISRRVLKLII